MERLFLCCFRSCLKGDDDKEFYVVLDIEDPYRATTDQIKKQYKKLSLNLHPDKLAQRGITVTQEHRQQFIRLKEAYDVLSDPKRRRLYDEYGATGLKLMENPTEVDHTQLLKNFQKNRGDRTTLGLAIAGVFAFFLVLPILFSLKCDGTLNSDAKWVAIWTPMWIIDILLLVSAGMILFDKGSKNHGEDAQNEEDDPTSTASDKIPLHEKLINLLSTILFFLIQIFILIRLDKYTDWSWFAVFAPWFAYEGLAILAAFPNAFLQKLEPPNHETTALKSPGTGNGGDEENGGPNEEEANMAKLQAESKYFEKQLEQDRERRYIVIHLLRVWLAIFLALQLDNIVDWNWGLVLLPIWIYLFIHYIYAYFYRIWANEKLKGVNVDEIEANGGVATDPIDVIHLQQSSTLSSSAVYLCMAQAVPLFMAIMLVCRLQSGSYSTFLIILPIFLIIGCCCCLVFCGLIGMSVVDTEALDEEIAAAQRGGSTGGNENGGAAAAGGVVSGNDKESTNIYSPPSVNDGKYGTFRPDEVQTPLQEKETNSKSEGNASNSPSGSYLSPSHQKDSEKEKLVNENTIDVDID